MYNILNRLLSVVRSTTDKSVELSRVLRIALFYGEWKRRAEFGCAEAEVLLAFEGGDARSRVGPKQACAFAGRLARSFFRITRSTGTGEAGVGISVCRRETSVCRERRVVMVAETLALAAGFGTASWGSGLAAMAPVRTADRW